MVVSLGQAPAAHAAALVDGTSGIVIFDPEPATREAFLRRMAEAATARLAAEVYLRKPASVLANGTSVQVLINVAEPEELYSLDAGDL